MKAAAVFIFASQPRKEEPAQYWKLHNRYRQTQDRQSFYLVLGNSLEAFYVVVAIIDAYNNLVYVINFSIKKRLVFVV